MRLDPLITIAVWGNPCRVARKLEVLCPMLEQKSTVFREYAPCFNRRPTAHARSKATTTAGGAKQGTPRSCYLPATSKTCPEREPLRQCSGAYKRSMQGSSPPSRSRALLLPVSRWCLCCCDALQIGRLNQNSASLGEQRTAQ